MKTPDYQVQDVIFYRSAKDTICSAQIVFIEEVGGKWLYTVSDGFDRIKVKESSIVTDDQL